MAPRCRLQPGARAHGFRGLEEDGWRARRPPADGVARCDNWRLVTRSNAWLAGDISILTVTGFHPLDGARWLRDHAWPAETCRLVAWHTEPLQEARLYGLDKELASGEDLPRDPAPTKATAPPRPTPAAKPRPQPGKYANPLSNAPHTVAERIDMGVD